MPPVISGVVSVSSSGSSPGRNSLRMNSLSAALMSSATAITPLGASNPPPFDSPLRAGKYGPLLLDQLPVDTLGDQCVTTGVGMIVPFSDAYRCDILVLIYIGEIDDNKARGLRDPEDLRRFLLPSPLANLREE